MSGYRFSRPGGFPCWRWESAATDLVFVGRGPRLDRKKVLTRIDSGAPTEIAWLRQVHGSRAIEAGPGECGEGDALWTGERSLALAVSTADCVPVVLASGEALAVVHAGWRGLVAGVLSEAADHLGRPATAWIGPAIGPCCYEVGRDVAEEIVRTSSESILRRGPGAKPRVDLVQAARFQLDQLGIETAGAVELCTRCHPDLLCSFRRKGSRAGRNLTFAWRR